MICIVHSQNISICHFTSCMLPTTIEKNLQPPHSNVYSIAQIHFYSCPRELSHVLTSSFKRNKKKKTRYSCHDFTTRQNLPSPPRIFPVSVKSILLSLNTLLQPPEASTKSTTRGPSTIISSGTSKNPLNKPSYLPFCNPLKIEKLI